MTILEEYDKEQQERIDTSAREHNLMFSNLSPGTICIFDCYGTTRQKEILKFMFVKEELREDAPGTSGYYVFINLKTGERLHYLLWKTTGHRYFYRIYNSWARETAYIIDHAEIFND